MDSPGQQRAAAPPAASTARAGLVMTTVCLCQLVVVLDASVVNLAVPSIGRALDFSGASLSWVVNAYTLAFGGLLLLGGRVADWVGHRRAVLWGLAVFGVASFLGSIAQDAGQLVAARAGQGVAAAVLAPVSLTIIMVTFPEGPLRRRAIGLWAMVAALGSALGVLMGGLLTDLLDWRWVLFVNVPIVAVTVRLALRAVHETRELTRRRLDIAGAVLGTAATTLVVYGVVRVGQSSWGDGRALAGLGAAVVSGSVFLWWESRIASAPLVRFGILSARNVWLANVVVASVGAATITGFYFASLFLQNVLGYRPLQAGLAFLPFCFGVVVGALLSGRLAAALGSRWTIGGGLAIGAAGMYLFSRLDTSSTFASGFLLPSVVASVGIGVSMVANTSLGVTGVDPEEAGLASALLNTSRQLGGSIALAAFTALAVRTARSEQGDALHATVTGYQHAFAATAILLLVGCVVALTLTPGEPGRRQRGDAFVAIDDGRQKI